MVTLGKGGERTSDCPVNGSFNVQDDHLLNGLEVGATQDRKGEYEPDCEPRSGTGNRDSEHEATLIRMIQS